MYIEMRMSTMVYIHAKGICFFKMWKENVDQSHNVGKAKKKKAAYLRGQAPEAPAWPLLSGPGPGGGGPRRQVVPNGK